MTAALDDDLDSLSLVSETALDNGDPCFTQAQLDRFSNTLLRRLAAEAKSDEIHGKSPQLLTVSYFRCQYSLTEFAD